MTEPKTGGGALFAGGLAAQLYWTGQGVQDLLAAVEKHREAIANSGELEKRRLSRARARIREIVDELVLRSTWSGRDERLEELANRTRRH